MGFPWPDALINIVQVLSFHGTHSFETWRVLRKVHLADPLLVLLLGEIPHLFHPQVHQTRLNQSAFLQNFRFCWSFSMPLVLILNQDFFMMLLHLTLGLPLVLEENIWA